MKGLILSILKWCQWYRVKGSRGLWSREANCRSIKGSRVGVKGSILSNYTGYKSKGSKLSRIKESKLPRNDMVKGSILPKNQGFKINENYDTYIVIVS